MLQYFSIRHFEDICEYKIYIHYKFKWLPWYNILDGESEHVKDVLREAAKSNFFNGPATKRGGGVKGLATKKFFLKLEKKHSPKKCDH